MTVKRRKSRVVKIGNIRIGGDNPIVIQSMAKSATKDINNTVKQIRHLEKAGCQIVRLSIKNREDARAINNIKERISIPLVADIHFDYRLALEAVDNGADKIRLNPGNIYRKSEIKEIICALKLAKIPLRIGLNSGSVRDLDSKRLSLPDKLVASALNYIEIVEKLKFYDIVVSLKASSVLDTIEAYHKMAKLCDYPFHLGITATGLPESGRIKSAIGIGTLLAEGIGDTIRVSLTSNPEEEVEVAKEILQSLGLKRFKYEIISCPTCGRCEVDLVSIVKDFEKKLNTDNCKLLTVDLQPLRVAIMGCVVNGPGEAKEVDIGIAAGRKSGLLFKKGKIVRKVPEREFVNTLIKEISTIN